MIDSSGRFAKGFDTSEAYSLLELCINANNLGEPGYNWQADDWTPIYPAVATDPAQVIGPGTMPGGCGRTTPRRTRTRW